MKINRAASEIGEFDIHLIDEQQNKIASLLRNVDKRGYTMFIHVDVKDYVPLECNTYPQAVDELKKVLIKNGYTV